MYTCHTFKASRHFFDILNFILVRRLLMKGVSPSATNEDGLTALHQVLTAFALKITI